MTHIEAIERYIRVDKTGFRHTIAHYEWPPSSHDSAPPSSAASRRARSPFERATSPHTHCAPHCSQPNVYLRPVWAGSRAAMCAGRLLLMHEECMLPGAASGGQRGAQHVAVSVTWLDGAMREGRRRPPLLRLGVCVSIEHVCPIPPNLPNHTELDKTLCAKMSLVRLRVDVQTTAYREILGYVTDTLHSCGRWLPRRQRQLGQLGHGVEGVPRSQGRRAGASPAQSSAWGRSHWHAFFGM